MPYKIEFFAVTFSGGGIYSVGDSVGSGIHAFLNVGMVEDLLVKGGLFGSSAYHLCFFFLLWRLREIGRLFVERDATSLDVPI